MAYEGYTTHAAIAAGRQDVQGKIKPGYLADFTVLAANPLKLTPEQQATNPVLSTVLDGRLQFTALQTPVI
jgi:predicted amidohydrolase YtcJ